MNALVSIVLLHLLAAAPAEPVHQAREAARAEQEHRYADALTMYTRILNEAPTHYVARTARARSEELLAHRDFNFVPFARYQRLLREYAARGSDLSLTEARQILTAYPDATIAAEIQFWIGNEYREARRDAASAKREYRLVVDRYPQSPLAPIALDRIGRMLESKGEFSEAAKIYEEMQRRYPAAATPNAYAGRRSQVEKNIWRKRAAAASWSILVLGAILFAGVGGWRFNRRRWRALAVSKIGFSLFIGLTPAAYLWITDGQWSPSLTMMGFAFALYGGVLAAMAARTRLPAGAWLIPVERMVFNALAPLSILYLIVHYFKFWEAFYF